VNNDFLRREWGAVAFLVATALGVVVVPVGLNLNRRNVPAATESLIQASPSPGASVSPSASPAASPSAVPSPSGAASPAPSPSHS
jgi:hypothetical protein